MHIIGIDLGTTNSAACVFRNSKPELIPNRYGDYLTPSVVYVDKDDQLIVGKHAQEKLKTDPSRAAGVFKRAMGTNTQFTLGNKSFNATELSALVIKVIKDDAEQHLGEPVEQAIISVPAYFNENQRKATKMAAEMAGLNVERLINEPTAAAMAYGIHEKPEDTRFMVLDLGGGTFDVSIMEYFDGILEVHACAGDNFLGGEDFLEYLVMHYLKQASIEKSQLSPTQYKQLYSLLQKALHALSNAKKVEIPNLLDEQADKIIITRDEFTNITQPLIHKMHAPIERALKDSDTHATDLDQIVLVGGATRMPTVGNLVAHLFKKMPARNIDPDLVVAMGAGIQAGLCSKDEALNDVVLTDVCPFTLGIAIVNHSANSSRQGELFSPIIERNSIVPVSRVNDYCTVSDNQEEIGIQVYQGESRLVKNNVYLGEIDVKVKAAPAGQEVVDVRFSYDMNGLLEVDVKVISTGEKQNLVINNSAQKLSDEDIQASRKKLAKLKIHPRNDEVNQHLLMRAEKLYESSTGELREHINHAISQFEATLDKQNLNEISQYQKEFAHYLDDLEKHNLFD